MRLKSFSKNLILLGFVFLFWSKAVVTYATIPSGVSGKVFLHDFEGNLIPLEGVRINREDSGVGPNGSVETITSSDGMYYMDNKNNNPGPIKNCDDNGANRCPAGILGQIPDNVDCSYPNKNWCGFNCGSNPHRWKAYFPPGYTFPGDYSTKYSTISGYWKATNEYCGPKSGDWGKTGNQTNSNEPSYYEYGFKNDESWNYCDFVWIPEATPTPTPTPTPTLYPTVAIHGNLKEYLGSYCAQGIYSPALSIAVTPQAPQGITSSCGIIPPSGNVRLSYRCTLTLNNQTAKPTPAQQVNLSVNSSSYSSAYWTENNLCSSDDNNSLAFNVAAPVPTNVFEKDIFFNAEGPWIKLKDASVNKYEGSSLDNPIPNNILPYDDRDDNSQRYLIIGNAGVVLASAINLRGADVSLNKWRNSYSYSPIKRFDRNSFINYVRSRKEYQTIDNLNQLSEEKINVYENDLSINSANYKVEYFNNKKILILVNGNVSINVNNPFPDSSSVAIIANTITFSPDVKEVYGVFIANTINTGSTTDQGLKIKGNLIALSSFDNKRRWQDSRRPSVFIVFDPSIYLNLLDKLSIAKYDWQQTR